jgi:hypothetical protein
VIGVEIDRAAVEHARAASTVHSDLPLGARRSSAGQEQRPQVKKSDF